MVKFVGSFGASNDGLLNQIELIAASKMLTRLEYMVKQCV